MMAPACNRPTLQPIDVYTNRHETNQPYNPFGVEFCDLGGQSQAFNDCSTATDAAGNKSSASSALDITIDSTAPDTPIITTTT